MRSKNGPISDELLTSEWADYFRGVLNSETDASGPPLATLEQPQPRKIDSSRFNTAEFSSEELNDAIKSLINDLDFADDIVLLENCIEIANRQLESLRAEAARVGLVINEKKTEVMTFNIDQASSNSSGSGVYLSGVELTKVDNFRYLGSMMKSTTSDFEHRRGLAWSAFGSMERIWKAKHLDLALKL